MNDKQNELLEQAKVLLRRALAVKRHDELCNKGAWLLKNAYLPSNHPAHNAPGCSCWIGDAETFLNLN
jgi:hypothetical protein